MPTLPPLALSASFTLKSDSARSSRRSEEREEVADDPILFMPNFHVSAMVFWNAASPPVTLRASSPLRELRAKCFFQSGLRPRLLALAM
jgi:hypothetical protein